jgi:uncharacterized membrane protein YtjA (UPF0391 family)
MLRHAKATNETVVIHLKCFIEDKETMIMLSWALAFLIFALIAGVLGFSGLAGTAANIAWILFVVGLLVSLVLLIFGRRGAL